MSRLLVSDLEKSSIGDVYVLNKTSGNNRADIIFTVPGLAGGQGESIKVPITWIPVELTVYATKQQLINSVPFRRMINDGYLEIMSPDEAQAILATEDGKEEMAEVRSNAKMAENLMARPDAVVGGADIQDPAKRRAQTAARDSREERTEPDAIVQQAMSRLNDGEITEGQFISQMRTMGNDLTNVDYAYMLEKVVKARNSRVYTFLTEEAIRRGGLEKAVDDANARASK